MRLAPSGEPRLGVSENVASAASGEEGRQTRPLLSLVDYSTVRIFVTKASVPLKPAPLTLRCRASAAGCR